MKILIIEDSEVISKRLEESLMEINGVETVIVAEDGLQAVSEFDKTNPDLVILDLMIPRMSGLDVLRNIRLKNDNVPVIIFTNYSQTYFRELTKSIGADYFLDKSAEFDKVYQICIDILNPHNEQKTDYLLLSDVKRRTNG